MDSLETLRHEIEDLDNTTLASNDTTIGSVRECIHRPLTMLSPGLIKHITWEQHIWMLLHTLIPRWAFILTTTAEDRDALVVSLIGSSSSCSEQLRSDMAQTSLPLLLECIRDHHTSTTATSMDVLDLYTSLLKHYFSASMMAIYLRQASGFTDRLSFCSLLCSIPSRLSNAYGLQQINNDDDNLESGHAWYSDSRFYSTLTKYVAVQVGLLCKDQKDTVEMDKTMTEGVTMASELIGKMIRQGHHNTCIETIAPIAIQHNSAHSSQCCSIVWDTLWTLCEKVAPAEKVYSAILGYLNKHVEPLRQQRTSSSNNNNDLSSISIRSSIQSMATTLSPVLFTTGQSSQDGSIGRLQNFLAYTLKITSKIRLTDDLVLRTMVAMAVHSTGLEPLDMDEMTDDRAWKLSHRATMMVDQYLRNVLACWTDPTLIKQASDGERRYMTTLLLILFGYADCDMMEEMEYSTGIIQGISTWFRTSDEAIAKLAMIVAESMSLRTRNKGSAVLDFGIPMDQHLKDLKELALVADGLTKVVDDSSLILLPKSELPADGDSDDDLLDDTDQYLDPDVLIAPDDEEEEETSDLEPYPMEEESDDDDGQGDEKSDPKKKRARIPVYASELVAYLKDQEDPEKLEIGLNAAEQIIRQNTDIGTNIAEWAVDIGKQLINFPETYEIDNYQNLQQLSLASLIVACPKEITGPVIEQLFSEHTSIKQKNIIMAAISMAVLELSGWDSYSSKQDKGVNLNMEMLDMVAPSTSEVSKPNKSGQLVFSSTRTQAELKRQKGIVRNRLSGLAGPIFFFPMVTGWWEASQTRLRWMVQDPMMVERFIMTLNVIMQCASNTPDKKKIVKEYFDYALSLRYIPKLSSRILRALLLGINTILQICYKNQGYLVLTEYTLELAGTEKWLEDILEMQQQDKKLQQLAMTLLVSIGQLSKMGLYES